MSIWDRFQRDWLSWNSKLETPEEFMAFAVFLCFGGLVGALFSLATPRSTPWWQRLGVLLTAVALMAFAFFWA